jgi:hypothetical protein
MIEENEDGEETVKVLTIVNFGTNPTDQVPDHQEAVGNALREG